jgi:protein disulfide-isomerase
MNIRFLLLTFILLFTGVNFTQAQNNSSTTYKVVDSSEGDYVAENPGWLVDVEEAYQLSQKTGKPIMANFTGSDWCGWCKKLTRDVFVTDAFKKWADKNVILLELDFPRRKVIPDNIKAQNQALGNAMKVTGYPTVWVFNLVKDENTNQFSIEALGKTGYQSSPEAFIQGVDEILKNSK